MAAPQLGDLGVCLTMLTNYLSELGGALHEVIMLWPLHSVLYPCTSSVSSRMLPSPADGAAAIQ